jgi:2-(1,2-epoxy-1,2-dihydrophenyl)acetyl-CoA isomerase
VPDAPVTLAIESGVAQIVLNNPERGNPISEAFMSAFDEVTLECSERDDIRAVLISAKGKRFSVGGDIDMMTPDRATLPARLRGWNAELQGCIARLQHMKAPSVVAIQGVVAGGGLSLAAGCDIVVAADDARFVAAYATIGYCPDLGGTYMLTRRMGLSRARRFYLLHEQLDAKMAQETGIVDILAPAAGLQATAEGVAERWASGPTEAYAAIRALMHTAAYTPLEAQLEMETQNLARLTRTDDAWGALFAFKEKRTPTYNGR